MATYRDFSLMVLSYLMQHAPQGFENKVMTTVEDLNDSYDFIIVGGGSAGSVLANRLSEIPDWTVLLLEAGDEENIYSDVPVMYASLQGSLFDWNYTTTKQRNTCLATDGICSYPRGKALGGSSVINAMIYTRGYKYDYDTWKSFGNEGWDFQDVEPYFNKIRNVSEDKSSGVSIGYAPFSRKITEDIINSGIQMGLEFGNCQDTEKNCMEKVQNTMRNGSRCSAAKGYIEALSRKNLHILKKAEVTKLIIKNKTTKGVTFLHNGREHNLFSKKEVIVSAGAINSPKLLLLSGIGPKCHLEENNITLEVDLPVGENLQDHNRVPLFIEVQSSDPLDVDSVMNESLLNNYLQERKGPLTSTGIAALGFVKLGESKFKGEPPNVQYHISTFVGEPSRSLIAITTTVLRPKSRGTVRLASSNPSDTPLVDPSYYAEPQDFHLSLSGLKFSLALLTNKEFRKYRPKIFKGRHPECADEIMTSYLKCVIKYYSITNYHPVGTVKMAKDGVVNDKLQVYNIRNLRVIDASIAPKIISSNTNGMALMIGEKGSDIIKNHYNKI